MVDGTKQFQINAIGKGYKFNIPSQDFPLLYSVSTRILMRFVLKYFVKEKKPTTSNAPLPPPPPIRIV